MILMVLSFQLHAQIYYGTGGPIADDSSLVSYPISISGNPFTVIDSSFGLVRVCVSITHPHDSDLVIQLLAPDNTVINLTSENGGSGQNLTSTCFTDTSQTPVHLGIAPFTGAFRPEDYLDFVNNGQNPNGLWQLLVRDIHPNSNAGTLTSWSLKFDTVPFQSVPFDSSDLPIVKINTLDQVIPNNPKITCSMQIIANGAGIRNHVTDSANVYDGAIGIELHGSSTLRFPKKSFGLETRDSLGNNNNVSLLGMPVENDWLLNAYYADKSLIRNSMIYQLASDAGQYESRCRFVELVINGKYNGVYVLMEKIKRDINRIDISKLTTADTSGVNLTGGYIVRLDKIDSSLYTWPSSFPSFGGFASPLFQDEYPDQSVILPVQQQYIQSYIDSFEQALAGPQFTDTAVGYAKYIDVNSFIDYFLFSELAKSVDGYRISTYFSKGKDSKGGKIHMGPLWDYDIAFGNANFDDGELTTGWQYQFAIPTANYHIPFWWDRLFQDSVFTNRVHCRWTQLRSNIVTSGYMFNIVDSMATLLTEGAQRNFTAWPTLGIYVWPNPLPQPTTYLGAVNDLKSWIIDRVSWIDNNLPGICANVGIAEAKNTESALFVMPNPCENDLNITFKNPQTGPVTFTLLDVTGRRVAVTSRAAAAGEIHQYISLKNISPGLYVLEVQSQDFKVSTKVLHQ